MIERVLPLDTKSKDSRTAPFLKVALGCPNNLKLILALQPAIIILAKRWLGEKEHR